MFCANDLLALGVLQEMTQRGVRVPQDVAIVGYDDIDFAAAAAVPLSSVRQPREQLGRTAAELLLEEANEPAQARAPARDFQARSGGTGLQRDCASAGRHRAPCHQTNRGAVTRLPRRSYPRHCQRYFRERARPLEY